MLKRTPRSLILSAAILLTLTASSAGQGITTPKQFFGFNIGDDYQLATYDQFIEYWQKLDKESDRMKVVEIGKTAEGRPQLMAIITSPENFKKLDRYREIAKKLALAEGLTDDEARALAREGKSVVWRRRPARHRSPRRASVDRDELSAREPQRSRDAPDSERRHHASRSRESRRDAARVQLVHEGRGHAQAEHEH